ncbi:hypothetical protein F4808DRAFT_255200 [Astrocystis sublimbata]|nr:hypothetical protein F4808DRAFT_255200 [Astrocystis sublimbata]
MSDESEMDGFELQCPWSNCFPLLYESELYRSPCSKTPFPDFRTLLDHVWKYHSFILSCDHCAHRFTDGKRSKRWRGDLDKMKRIHVEEHHSDDGIKSGRDSRESIKTMTNQQDETLSTWQRTRRRREDTREADYISLCSSLFGDDIRTPENLSECYNYLVPEHKFNHASRELGMRNEAYILEQLLPSQSTSTIGIRQELATDAHQPIKDPLSLDEPSSTIDNWTVLKTKDSGYDSRPHGETNAENRMDDVLGSYHQPEYNQSSYHGPNYQEPDNAMELAGVSEGFAESFHDLNSFSWQMDDDDFGHGPSGGVF